MKVVHYGGKDRFGPTFCLNCPLCGCDVTPDSGVKYLLATGEMVGTDNAECRFCGRVTMDFVGWRIPEVKP